MLYNSKQTFYRSETNENTTRLVQKIKPFLQCNKIPNSRFLLLLAGTEFSPPTMKVVLNSLALNSAVMYGSFAVLLW